MTDLVLVGYTAVLVQRQQPARDTSTVVVPIRSSMDHPGLAEAPDDAMVGGLAT